MASNPLRAAVAAIACIGIGIAGTVPALAQTSGPSTMPNGARVPGANSAPGQGTDAPRGATPEVGSSTPVGTPSAPAEIIDRPVTPATSPASRRGGPSTPSGALSATPPATSQTGPARSRGLADCARKVDRDERASCASRLYGSPGPGR